MGASASEPYREQLREVRREELRRLRGPVLAKLLIPIFSGSAAGLLLGRDATPTVLGGVVGAVLGCFLAWLEVEMHAHRALWDRSQKSILELTQSQQGLVLQNEELARSPAALTIGHLKALRCPLPGTDLDGVAFLDQCRFLLAPDQGDPDSLIRRFGGSSVLLPQARRAEFISFLEAIVALRVIEHDPRLIVTKYVLTDLGHEVWLRLHRPSHATVSYA